MFEIDRIQLYTFDHRRFKSDPASPDYDYFDKPSVVSCGKRKNLKRKRVKKGSVGCAGQSRWHPGKQVKPKDWWHRR